MSPNEYSPSSSGLPALSEGLRGLRFSLLGAGRVGSSLALWLAQAGAQAIWVAGRRHGEELAETLRAEFCHPRELPSDGEDLLLVAVSDEALEEVAAELAGRRRELVVLHVSGSHDAEVLGPLRAAGAEVGSLHPLRAFPGILEEVALAAETFFAWDGDPAARILAERIVTAWGGRGRHLGGEGRVLYHYAATLAAGGVTTLLAVAAELAGQLDLPREVVDGYFDLAQGALEQARKAPHPALGITGPAARSDRDTLARHRAALEAVDPTLIDLFDSLGRATVERLRRAASGEE